jgi:hypothetical protein
VLIVTISRTIVDRLEEEATDVEDSLDDVQGVHAAVETTDGDRGGRTVPSKAGR